MTYDQYVKACGYVQDSPVSKTIYAMSKAADMDARLKLLPTLVWQVGKNQKEHEAKLKVMARLEEIILEREQKNEAD